MTGRIGFIGLGALGAAIAGRLASLGHDLVVWNRTPGKAAGLKAEVAASPAELISRSDTTFLCLRDSEAVWTVTSGQTGLFAGDCRDRTIIDLTTNHFEVVPALHALAAKAGADYLEAPVLGSVVPASQGTLTVLVSGDAQVFHRSRLLLEKIGRLLFFLGAPGLATRMKLANNLVLAVLMAAVAEATAVAERAGVPREQALDILAAGAGNSALLAAKRQKLLSGDFSPHFSAALLYKDLHYLQDLARAQRRPLFTAATVKELYALAFARGAEELDFSVIARLLGDEPGIPDRNA